jgi:hypothetical protein
MAASRIRTLPANGPCPETPFGKLLKIDCQLSFFFYFSRAGFCSIIIVGTICGQAKASMHYIWCFFHAFAHIKIYKRTRPAVIPGGLYRESPAADHTRTRQYREEKKIWQSIQAWQ